MKVLSARLRHRVDIEQYAETRDEFGGVVQTWSAYASDVPAEIVPLSGREFVAAQAMQGSVTTRITVRYDPSINPKMRIKHDGTIYNIRAVLPDPSLRRWLTLMCDTGANDG
jgi:SPP1 family predicted phage head-tail adaptor